MSTQPAGRKKPVSISYNLRKISVETVMTSAQPEMYIHFTLPDTAGNTISLCCLHVESSQSAQTTVVFPGYFHRIIESWNG